MFSLSVPRRPPQGESCSKAVQHRSCNELELQHQRPFLCQRCRIARALPFHCIEAVIAHGMIKSTPHGKPAMNRQICLALSLTPQQVADLRSRKTHVFAQCLLLGDKVQNRV